VASWPTVEERVGADQKRVGVVANERREGGLDLSAVARVNDVDPHSDVGGRRRNISRHGLGIRGIFRVDKSGNTSRSGHQFTQQSKSLGTQTKFSDEEIDAGRIAARPGEVGNETKFDRIVGDAEHDWNRRGRSLCRECRRGGGCDDDGHLTAH
jgi:hypothetical protein